MALSLRNRWKSFKKWLNKTWEFTKGFLSYLSHHAIRPLFTGLIVEFSIVIWEKIQEKGPDAKTFWQLAASSEVLALAFGFYIIHSIFEHYRYYGGLHVTIQYLNKILNMVPKPFKIFGLQRILESVKTTAVDLSVLADGGELKTDLENKLRLITNFIDNLPFKIERFWATSLDKPSTLMDGKFSSFFEAQRVHLRDIEDWGESKKRIVILSLEEMKSEMSQPEALTNFINWHKKNNFKLRFLFNKKNQFEEKVNSIIGKLTAKENALTDFAIIGEKNLKQTWIYGEQTTNKPKDAFQETTIQLYMGERETDFQIVQEYSNLYESLWNDWQHKTWFSLTPTQTLSEIYRKQKIVELAEQRDQYYTAYYDKPIDKVSYDDFLRRFESISDIHIKAIDLISLCVEDELKIWKATDFSRWYMANIDSVRKRRCTIERIYVINQSIANPFVAEEEYEAVFAPQIAAGIDIYFVNIFDLNQKNVPLHDFVFGDSKSDDKCNNFCSSVDLFTAFEENSFSIANLELPTRIKDYNKIFLKVKSLSTKINDFSSDQILQYLCNLNWNS